MKVFESNWMQIETKLSQDDRCVVPLGCTEQHAYLSLATDSILAEKVSVEAAGPLGVPVFPVLPYGVTPTFAAYPGTVSLSVNTYALVVAEIVRSLHSQGFSRIVLVNGHGGNSFARAVVAEVVQQSTGLKALWHDWWCAPRVLEAVKSIDPIASHASWMENFPWTRLESAPSPDGSKDPADFATLRTAHPVDIRAALGDGNFAGRYQREDDEMREIWRVAVEETRQIIDDI